jgi:allantoinase
MALEDTHLQYPMRRHGMDHERYAWSMLERRKPVAWPGGAKLAFWVNVSLEHFPLNPAGKPLKLPGSMTMPYPDLRHYTLRDYGNRVGIYRVLQALKQHGVQASFAVNAELCERAPVLVEHLLQHGGEVLGHSWNMDTPHAGGLERVAEEAVVQKSLATLRAATGQPVRGWLSPGKLQSEHTPELLKAASIEYCCDWVNDELPYRFETSEGALWNLPLTTEIEDRFVILDNQHSETSWAQQVIDAATLLLAEAKALNAGRVLALSIHPWVIGQPHRIKHLETVLAAVMAMPAVWSTHPGELIDVFAAQQ